MAVAGRRSVTLWDVATREVRASVPALTGDARPTLLLTPAIAFDPRGRTLAVAGMDGMVGLWDSATGERRYTFAAHADPVMAITFAPDGARLATGNSQGLVALWDTPPLAPGK